MAQPKRFTEADKQSMKSYLEMFEKAVDLKEYEIALTALESLRQMLARYLMEKHYGGK